MRKASLATILTIIVIGSSYLFLQLPDDAHTSEQILISKGKKAPKEQFEPGLFVQLHKYLQTEEGQENPAYEAGYQLREYNAAKASASKISASRIENVTWDERGPGNVSGRTPGIWIDPTDENIETWVLGSAGGGIWRTDDGGITWNPTTDEHPNLTTSDLRGSAANPNIVYAGTGKKFNATIQGNGMLKSTDRGQSWSVIESTLNDTKFANVTRIAVNQANEDELIVSTNTDNNIGGLGSFLLKSTDGGDSWAQVFVSGSRIQQVVASPEDFNIQFASINSTSIIRSTDAGENWETVFTVDSLHIDSQSLDRMEIAIAPDNINRVFLSVYVDDAGDSDSELYVSDNQGNSWSRVVGTDQSNDFGNWLLTQGWYDQTIAVHPYIDSCVVVAGVGAILKITLANQQNDSLYLGTLEVITDQRDQYVIEGVRDVGSKGVHVDHHNLVLWPIDEASQSYYLFNGNDGGLALSRDEGETFRQTGFSFGGLEPFRGYNTVEFYGVDKQNGEDRYIAGAQDNGTYVSGGDPGTDSEWSFRIGGDGFFTAWNYSNPNLLMGGFQNNGLARSTDGGNSFQGVQLPVSEGPFITEIENSKQDPDLVFLASPDGLLRSQDFGDSWEVLGMPDTWTYSGFSTRIAISLVNPEVIWSGATIGNNSRIARSTDGGNTWTSTAGYEDANRGAVTSISTHPSDENTAFALFSQANGPKILRTTDGGQSWEDISGFVTNAPESSNGFPDVPTYSVLVMPFDNDIIWVGTGIGIVESLDGGVTWSLKTDHNLPAVAVWDMLIVNDEVVIATHGRGIWSATLPELAGYEPPTIVLSPKLSTPDVSFGTNIAGVSTLRSAYDSTQIIARSDRDQFDDIVIHEQMSNEAGEVVNWSLDLASALANIAGDQQVDIIHTSWSAGVAKSRDATTRIIRLNDPVNSFFNPVDGDIVGNYIIDGFSVSSSLSIDGNAFHSPHPYRARSLISFTVRTPFTLDADSAVLRYNDVAIVEPGEDFGELFYDFVAIEAVKLPIETSQPQWIQLIRYDSRQQTDWLNAYNTDANAAPSADLFKEQRLDLYESGDFQRGDEILVRFILDSDPAAEGYGWVVDDISFNAEAQIVLSSSVNLKDQQFKVYPNPVQEVASFSYEMHTAGQAEMDIFDLEGKLIKHVDLGNLNRGTHQYQHYTTGMKPGIYVSILKTNSDTQTLKWILGQ